MEKCHGHSITTFLLLLLFLCVYSVEAEDYYWIGGSGNWSDINHWATESGGSILHIQIPTSADDVYFDQNSFSDTAQVITVNTENAICRSMDWTGAQFHPTILGETSNNIRIYGSLKFIVEMKLQFFGTIVFEGSQSDNIITPEGHSFHNHIFFDGIGGEWILEDSLKVNANIYLHNGTLNTNSQFVSCFAFFSNKTTERNLIISNSNLQILDSWNVNGTWLNLLAENSLLEISNELNSTDGDTLFYDRVIFQDTGTLISNNVQSVFSKVSFNVGGMASGMATIDELLFFTWGGTIQENIDVIYLWSENSMSIIGENTITDASIEGPGIILSENNIKKIDIGAIGIVTGSNSIQHITIADSGFVREQNDIGQLYINSSGLISGMNQVENAQLRCDGHFFGNNQFDTLTFHPGFRYFFHHGTTTEISSLFNITGNCQAPIYIKSDYNGLPATILHNGGIASGEYLSLRDMQAISTAGNFIALHSVDLGNNDGWDIYTSDPRDLYWVGGAGSWKDEEHWSETSGGAGGNCPPTEIDNVYIDAASLDAGDSLQLDVKVAVCQNMDWTGVGSTTFLVGRDTNYLKIYGSLTFSSSMENQFSGETHFESTEPGNEIYSAGNNLYKNVRIQGQGGKWKLSDELKVADTLYHDFGIFETKNNNIHTGMYYSNDTNNRGLFLYADTVYIKNSSWSFRLRATNLDLDADSSVIVLESQFAKMGIYASLSLVFNNVHYRGPFSEMWNSIHAKYNLITFDASDCSIHGMATIDTAIFYNTNGTVYDNDTIKTVIYHGDNGLLTGSHIVEIAYFFGSGTAENENTIDTALFYKTGEINGINTIDTTIIYDYARIAGENTIRTATLKDKGEFYGENIFNDLFLEMSKSYIFEHGEKQVIIDSLYAIGRCTGPIFLYSDAQGKSAGIEKVNGTIQVDYANLRDMQAFGNGIPFLATNSIDLGGNQDWDIYEGDAKALYWVGNSGNWSDSLHWAGESGGEPGYCIPSPIDDVYFDHNSFSDSSKVTINVDFATCRNMYWNGAMFHPSFTGESDQKLYLYGSLELIEEMNLEFPGNVHFSSRQPNNYLITADQSFKQDLIFDGPDGTWDLTDSLTVEHALYHFWGHLDTKGNPIQTRFFLSPDTNQRSLDMDTSTVYIIGQWLVRNTNLQMDADSLLIISTGPVISRGSSFDESLRYNDVIFNSATSLNNDTVYCFFDDVIFNEGGNVAGRCTIDSLFFRNSEGYVSGSDSINYCYFEYLGVLDGGEHQVHTAIFESGGSIDGDCKVHLALFFDSGTVSGNNQIDTTIFYNHGSIQGTNVFYSEVMIYGNGTLLGNNHVLKNLTIHGTANIFDGNEIFNALLLGWGYLGGPNVFGNLTFSPGNTYTLTAETQQTIIDTFNIRGNNCFPITLVSSSINNIQANIYKSSGEVSGDFIIMENIEAIGGADFYAGGHSDNIINNEGWIWDNAPGYIYGLGDDIQILCDGSTLFLSTENFNGNNSTIYEWFDGTISPVYEVSEPGEYSLMVIYSEDCSVPGEITVEQVPSPEVGLGPDGEICEGLWFQLPLPGSYSSYLWNDSTQADTVLVTQSGIYWLEVSNEHGCTDRDSVQLTLLPAPQVDLGPDLTLDNGDYIELDAGFPGGSFLWSTGSTDQTIQAQGMEGGNPYWVDVWYGGCKGSDTLLVDEYPYCTAQIPTAFTPNNDGVNDILYVLGSGIQTLTFQIYNRYGELVFETDDTQRGWDGTTNGEKQEIEVYTYLLKAICFDGLITQKSGNISLLR